MHKVKVLFLAATPAGSQPLKLDEEIRQITAKVRAAEYRDSLELVSRWAVRPDDLMQALLEVKPHVVHFSGHGSPAAELILLDDRGDPKPVGQEALVHLFRTLKDNVRVVVLNACYSRTQAEAIAKTIDCTVGMNRPIGDAAAIVFAASFYRALGFGRSVKEAFELGNAALLLEGIPEDLTPELLTRPGVEPGSCDSSLHRPRRDRMRGHPRPRRRSASRAAWPWCGSSATWHPRTGRPSSPPSRGRGPMSAATAPYPSWWPSWSTGPTVPP